MCALPLWWVLGLFSLMPLLVSIPMALQLYRQRTVHLPPGFGWWLLFLAWVALGLGVLFTDAPGAEPGGGAGRLLVFGYRAWWYLACAIVLLWVANAPRSALPDRRVLRLAGAVFAVTVLGGLLGMMFPTLEFRSALEYAVPRSLRANSFVSSLIHPQAAAVENVLGQPAPRPEAPYPFTNSWGSGLSLSVVFFVALLRTARPAFRVAAAVLMAAAVIPVLYSLNRGLWVALAAGVVGLGLLFLAKGRGSSLIALSVAAALCVVIGLASPLGNVINDRLAHQHSNDRRSQLLTSTVDSVSSGSPVVGFGSTRNVQGSFASISGGSTPDCPACGVPPLGTQGQLWLILFSQGWFGLAFFLIFVLMALSRSWRCRTTNETICTFVVAIFLLQLAVYDSLGLPLFLVMIAIGLVCREQHLAASTPGVRRQLTARAQLHQVRRSLPAVTVLTALGLTTGAVFVSQEHPGYDRAVSVALAPTPVSLMGGLDFTGTTQKRIRAVSVDTEAALLGSREYLQPAAQLIGVNPAAGSRAVAITAAPNTRILRLSVHAPTRRLAIEASNTLATSYLRMRSTDLERRRNLLAGAMQGQLRVLGHAGAPAEEARTLLGTALNQLALINTSAGRVVNRASPVQASDHRGVAMTTGVALGLLAGLGSMSLRSRRRWRR